MIPLLVVGTSLLVFDLDHVRALRDAGIVGVLAGSLPKAPQQNLFLGLPLRLSLHEALWVVEAGLGVLVDAASYSSHLASNTGSALVSTPKAGPFAVTLDTNKLAPTESLEPFIVSPETLIETHCHGLEDPDSARRHLRCTYAVFKYLRELRYFMMPGLRFGGTFVAYPGDPLKFHSHLIVKVLKPHDKVDLIKLVASGRLATAVKKAWLLVSVDCLDCTGEDKLKSSTATNGRAQEETPQVTNNYNSAKVKAFSIEWAGFG